MKKFYLIIFISLASFFAFGQQLTTENILYDGNNRQYLVYVPQSYSSSSPTPILFAFHGGSGYANDFMNYEADFRPIADTAGFILVYPQALEDPNDGGSTNWLHKEPTDHKDEFFVETLIDTLSSVYNIDNSRVYACGYSLGGMFSYTLACSINDKIAAIGSVAGACFYGAFAACNVNHPTAVLTINGTDDGIHPYNDPNGWYFPVTAIDSFWATTNNTDITPIVTQVPDINPNDGSTVERYSWQNGNGCVSVEELKIINGGHDWPSPLNSWANQDINANVEIWNFVSKFNTSGLINCSSTNTENQQLSQDGKLVKRFNLLGKEVKNGSLVIDLFDNGKTKKVFIVK